MRKLVFLLILVSAVIGGVNYFNINSTTRPSAQGQKHLFTQTLPVPSLEQPAQVQRPIRLSIPKINVDTDIESVGLDSQKRMDVPKNVDNVGWYNLGYKPGEAGSAVLSGHFDRSDGSPAVFYSLNNIMAGDEITVADAQNQEHVFKVTEKKSYPYDQLPLKEIFASSGKAGLNLITCAGSWNAESKNYSTRTVVYAVQQ